MDDGEAVEARLLDPVLAGAAGGLEADRPGRVAVFRHIEEVSARLQRVERPAYEVDAAAAALRAHDEGRAAAVAEELDPDRAVGEDIGSRIAGELGRRAGEPGRRLPRLAPLPSDDRDRDGGEEGDAPRRRPGRARAPARASGRRRAASFSAPVQAKSHSVPRGM